jgi:hypothetical protein
MRKAKQTGDLSLPAYMLRLSPRSLLSGLTERSLLSISIVNLKLAWRPRSLLSELTERSLMSIGIVNLKLP